MYQGCILMLLFCFLGTGCASWSWKATATKSLTGLHESLKGASAVGEKHYGTRCVELAKKCTSTPCQPAEDCLKDFRRFNKVILGARASIHLGQGTVAMGDKKLTMVFLLKASTLFDEVKNILTKAGVLQ